MSGGPAFSVIIPAHNEAAVIGRCLETLLRDAPEDAMPEIIVAANGCKDETVAIAKRLAPSATVLDLPAGSKVIAMNAANALAAVSPRFFLDADVQCSYAALVATAEVLRQPGIMAASPALEMDLSRSDFWVRAYYRVWLTQPYVTDRLVGSGVFGLSAEGLERIGEIPEIIGDDIWVHTRFSYDERRNASEDADGKPVSFTVSPPRKLWDQIRVEARRRIGNEQVRTLHPSPHYARLNRAGNFRTALTNGASVFDIAIYLAIKVAVLAQVRLNKVRGKENVWVRDIGARTQS